MEKVQILKQAGNRWVPALDCSAQFNPSKLQVSKKSSWKTEKAPLNNIGTTTFGGGDPMSLSFELFFDTTATSEDVRQYTSTLLELAMIPIGAAIAETRRAQLSQLIAEKNAQLPAAVFDPTKRKQLEAEIRQLQAQMPAAVSEGAKQPPKCKFLWGKFTSFVGYIESVNVTFVMFLQDGTPVRAKAKVTLKQIEESALYPLQNPTSRSAARKMWVVREGQRLDWIAYQEYGDPTLWRYIAEANDLDDPQELSAGQVLNLSLMP